jgi:hypothetical protein
MDSYAQFIYLCYALFSTMRLRQDLLFAPISLFLCCFYLCVSEPASVQMRVLYDEHLIIAVLNAIV